MHGGKGNREKGRNAACRTKFVRTNLQISSKKFACPPQSPVQSVTLHAAFPACATPALRLDRRVSPQNSVPMENVILTIHLILALLLIGVVLLQRSEGGGLGMGGGGNSVMSGRGAATALAKLTWVFAVCFIATSMTLTYLAAVEADSGSVIDQFGGTQSNEGEAPAPVAPGADLLPPATADAPATPPRAED